MYDEDESVIEPRVSEQVAGRLEGVQRAASGAYPSSAWIGDGERFRVFGETALRQFDARARCLWLVRNSDVDRRFGHLYATFRGHWIRTGNGSKFHNTISRSLARSIGLLPALLDYQYRDYPHGD